MRRGLWAALGVIGFSGVATILWVNPDATGGTDPFPPLRGPSLKPTSPAASKPRAGSTTKARIPAPVLTSASPARSASAGLVPAPCPRQMVLVEGAYCEEVQHHCRRWLDDPNLPYARCGDYQPPAKCLGPRRNLRFCIDRYEYTEPGEKLPLNQQSFVRAQKICQNDDKRLCQEQEWNFACEGEQMRPYPYGWSRAPVCNQDRDDLYERSAGRQVLKDNRNSAGANPRCVSPFGVYDLVGNLDEPVQRTGVLQYPFRNALKGGWWMAARNRCRPATTAHDDHYQGIQVGARCCRDAR